MPKPIDFNKPCETTEGAPVRILCTDRISTGGWVVVGLLGDYGPLEYWQLDGTAYGRKGNDLVNPVIKTSKFRKVYNDAGYGGAYYWSKQRCIDSPDRDKRIGILEVQYEDGVAVDIVLHKEKVNAEG